MLLFLTDNLSQKVSCKHGHVVDRNTFQDWLSTANPTWADYVKNLEMTGQKLRTNPDGDVAIEGANYDEFVVPDCPDCTLEHKRNNVVSDYAFSACIVLKDYVA